MTDTFGYDVFVSRRREPDRGWVHDRLVPRLRADSLIVCLDDDCFPAWRILDPGDGAGG